MPNHDYVCREDERQADLVCNAFEDAYRSGKDPKIEEYLAKASKQVQAGLLRELVALELELQSSDSEIAAVSSLYLSRFPMLDADWLAAQVRQVSSPSRTRQFKPERSAGSDGDNRCNAAGDGRWLQQGSLLGDYEIVEEIAQGGMGAVFKARQLSLDRFVAIKVMLAGKLASSQEHLRFKIEGESAATLDHPHIVPVYDFGENDGIRYLVMKLIEGGNLAQHLGEICLQSPRGDNSSQASNSATTDSRTQLRRITRLTIRIARAVHFAHQRGVLHRDLKPSNILLDSKGEPHVTDFGLARRMDAGAALTQTHSPLGTPTHMAPETISQGVGAATTGVDVYSLGVILYQLLTGQTLFPGCTPLEMLRRVALEDPIPPRALNARIPEDLQTMCLRCLQKEPHARYPSAEALANDLERFEQGEPIRARPVGGLERAWMWLRRNPRVALTLGLVAAFILLLSIGSTIAAVSFREQRDRARRAEAAERDKLAAELYISARGRRLSGGIGRRLAGLETLKNAADILHSLELPAAEKQQRLMELRNEVIASVALADIEVTDHWPLPDGVGASNVAVDAQHRHFATADRVGSISLWRTVDQKCVATFTQADCGGHWPSFSDDGRLLAASFRKAGEIAVSIWDIARKELILEAEPISNFASFTLSPDGLILATAQLDGTIKLLELSTESVIQTLRGSRHPNQVKFSPNGQYLAVSSSEGNVNVWDLAARRLLRQFAPVDEIDALDWSADGSLLAAAGGNYEVLIWEFETGNQIAALKGHRHHVTDVKFHAGGKLLVSSSWDGTTRFWEFQSSTEILRTSGNFRSFDPTGTHLSFYNKGALGRWKLHMNRACAHLWGHFEDPSPDRKVIAAAHSHDGQLLATAGLDGVRIWNATTLVEITLLQVGQVVSLSFHPTTGHLFIGNLDGLYEWPIGMLPGDREFQIGPPISWDVPGHNLMKVAISVDGSTLVTNAHDQVTVFRNGSRLRIDNAAGRYVAVSPDGQWIATDGYAGNVQIYSSASGELIHTLNSFGDTNVGFSPDGRWLVTSSTDTLKFWHTGTWTESHRYGDSGRKSFAFSPTGKFMAIASLQATDVPNTVDLVDPQTGRLYAKLENTPAPTQIQKYLSFTPDGTRIAVPYWTASTFAVWDLRHIHKQLVALRLDWGLPLELDNRPTIANTMVSMHIDWGEHESLRFDYLDRARLNASLYHWTLAASDYWKAHQETARTTDELFEIAAAQLIEGRIDRYLEICDRLLGDFANSRDPPTLQSIARTAFISRLVLTTDLGTRAQEFTERAAGSLPSDAGEVFTLALAHYRMRNYQHVLELVDEFLEQAADPADQIGCWLIMGMTHYQLGHQQEAQQWVDRTRPWINNSGDLNPADWLAVKVLRDEVVLLLNSEEK